MRPMNGRFFREPLSMRRTAIAVLVCLAAPAPTVVAQQDSGQAARRVRELIEIINTATIPTIRAYVDSACDDRFRQLPLAEHVGFVFGARDRSRGMEFHSYQEVTPTLAVALVRTRLAGAWEALAVRVEPDPPHRIAGIGSRPPQVPPGATAAPASDPERAQMLDAYVSALAAADVFSGAVLLAKDGNVLLAKAWGEANKDFGAPNRLDTKFNLGSMNKMFTAVAIAQLVEAGKLSFEDPLAKFLPDFPSPEAAQQIRIKHLLTHTAGLGSYFNDEFMRSSRARFRTVDDMMTLAQGDSMAFEPGTRWSYSNTGMLVLGKVIEVVTGGDYFAYVRSHIYGPAGMVSSDAYELDLVNPNLAVGYDKEFLEDGTVRFRNNIFQHVIRGGPAGGGYSTVEDLLHFAEALRSGKLVGAEYVRLLTTPKPEISSPRYGYGFSTPPDGPVGHSGGFDGISSNLDIYLGSGYVAVVMSNYGGGSAPVTAKMRELIGRPAAMP
jgi:CubicO group peptidase (beta-lactamase class C family)